MLCMSKCISLSKNIYGILVGISTLGGIAAVSVLDKVGSLYLSNGAVCSLKASRTNLIHALRGGKLVGN